MTKQIYLAMKGIKCLSFLIGSHIFLGMPLNIKPNGGSLFSCCKPLLLIVKLFDFSINLLAFYHQHRSLIGYATHYLFCDR